MGPEGWGCLALFAFPVLFVILWMIGSIRFRHETAVRG